MCGIIGAYGTNNVDRYDMKQLFMMAEDRGGHGCGITDCKTINKTTTKSPIAIAGLKRDDIKRFIGHTRYKTIGPVDEANNHPFEFSNLIGAHNGTISNKVEIEKEEGVEFGVDSELLYYLINKYGLLKTLPRLKGKLALAYFDKRNEKIILYRWDRPMSIGYKNGAIYFASVGDYLTSIGCTGVKEIPEHKIYELQNGKIIKAKNVKKSLAPNQTLKEEPSVDGTNIGANSQTSSEIDYSHVPTYARGGIIPNDGTFFSWWFENQEEHIVFIQVLGEDIFWEYNLLDGNERNILKDTLGEVYYKVITTTYEDMVETRKRLCLTS